MVGKYPCYQPQVVVSCNIMVVVVVVVVLGFVYILLSYYSILVEVP